MVSLSTALALPKVVITELLDGHRCQCFECNPNIKEDLRRKAVKEARESGLAELKEENSEPSGSKVCSRVQGRGMRSRQRENRGYRRV